MLVMRTIPNKSEPEAAPPKPANAKPPDIASASVLETLTALHVNPDTGLTHAEVNASRKEHGYNEVAVKKEHPINSFGNSGEYRRGCSN
jgi:H+-transporting ATPase